MSTTTLIVEVVIIGAQVLVWIFLALIALFGVRRVEPPIIEAIKDFTTPIAVALIALSYTLGIVCDMLLALFFARWAMLFHRNRFTGEGIGESPVYMRAYVMVNNAEAFQDLERLFNQTKLLRATVFNGFLIGVLGTIVYWQNYEFSWFGLLRALLLWMFLAGLTYFSWQGTSRRYYHALDSTFSILREREKPAATTDPL